MLAHSARQGSVASDGPPGNLVAPLDAGDRSTRRVTHIDAPHADDIVADADLGVRFIGPIDEAEQAKMEETRRMRDLLLIQDHNDQCPCMPDVADDPEKAWVPLCSSCIF